MQKVGVVVDALSGFEGDRKLTWKRVLRVVENDVAFFRGFGATVAAGDNVETGFVVERSVPLDAVFKFFEFG